MALEVDILGMRIVSKMNSMISHLITMISRLIKKLFFLLELFLLVRLIFKFLAASPRALIVKLVYKWSNFFVAPFNFIFKNIFWPKDHLIETATISAMVGYAILVYVVLKLLQPFSKD